MVSFKKGQLAPFFIAVILIIIIAALITVNIGEISRSKTYSSNATDASALAAASILAHAFNYAAKANVYLEENYENFKEEADKHFDHAWPFIIEAIRETEVLIEVIGTGCTEANGLCAALKLIPPIIQKLSCFKAEIDLLYEEIVPDYHRYNLYKIIREKIHDDYDNQNDFYTNALVAAHKFSFQNSGIRVKLKEDGPGNDSKVVFERFVRSGINIRSVRNGQEKAYSWLDGQQRSHRVSTKIEIDPIRTYRAIKTKLSYREVMELLYESATYAQIAIDHLYLAFGALSQGCRWDMCCPPEEEECCPKCNAFKAEALGYATSSLSNQKRAWSAGMKAQEGLEIDEEEQISTTKDDFVVHIVDIVHNRQVKTYNTQEHEGSRGQRIAELWETEYPLIESFSRATFNYRGGGSIYPQRPFHDAALLEVR